MVAAEAAVGLEPDVPVWQFHLANTYERLDPVAAGAAWRRYLQLALGDAAETERVRIARARIAELE
jgi:hypothetical protein